MVSCFRRKEVSLSVPQSHEGTVPSQGHKTSPQADEEVVSNALAPGDLGKLGAERNSQGDLAEMATGRMSQDSQRKVSILDFKVLQEGIA